MMDKACQEKRCTYYTFHLAYLPPDRPVLRHDVYHAKEEAVARLQKAWKEWREKHGTWDGFPQAALCERLEREIGV